MSRRFVEQCYRTSTVMINPIVDWIDNDVWDFLNHYNAPHNPLYDEGYKRIGRIGCPMAGKCKRMEGIRRYPKYMEAYIRAFDRMIIRRKERGLPTVWNSGEECFKWWIEDDVDQIAMFDVYGDINEEYWGLI